MKLLVNTSSSFKGGGIQTSNSFLSECRKYPENEYHVILGLMLAEVVDADSFPDNFKFYKIPYRPATKVFSLSRADGFMSKVENQVKPDCVYSIGGPAYWRPKAPHIMGYTLPHYIYPESPFFKTFSLLQKIKWGLKGMVIKHFIEQDADEYVVQTDDVNVRLREWIGSNKVHTITNAFGSYFINPDLTSDLKLPPRQEGEKRLLMLSVYYTHKNFEIINEISAKLDAVGNDRIKFILTLPDEILKRVFTPTALKRIINIGPIKPRQCPGLYAQADFVFLPTLLECFSANYVEGMVMEKPILTSDMSFAETVCGEAAVYFDPLDADDIIDKTLGLIGSPELQQQLIKQGKERLKVFNTAEERALKVLGLCQNASDSASRN